MAFTTIPTALIAVGKALKRELFSTYIKDSLDDLDTRVSSIETISKIDVFNYEFKGNINDYGSEILSNIDMFKTFSALSILEAKLTLVDANSTTAGTLEVDILKSTDGASYSSIFSTQPSIGVGISAEGTQSNNFVVDSGSVSIAIGTYLKLSITSTKPTQGSFHLLVYGEPT